MKNILLFAALFCIAGFCYAQPGEWVWMHGPNTVNDPGVFGVQGVSDPANNPPAVYEACEWTDQNGNFWLYGGLDGNSNEYGDVWKYNPAINEWVWMKGTGLVNTLPNYGVMGVPSPANDPGSRSWGIASWVDNQGNFWMFGGSGAGTHADLWRFEPATNNWTWMKGPQGSGSLGVYGTQGVPDPANFPACRYETAAAWTDNSGDLWLFGGYSTTRNDLWRYNISLNEWTWMKGSQFGGAPNVYGVQGVEDPANTPGARAIYSHWKDLSGNLWLFGGTTFSAVQVYNDLWRYNPVTNNWAWIKGGTSSGVYGIQCIADTANTPGRRFENRATVTDVNGNFWLFGGAFGTTSLEGYNDLWLYCVSTNSWKWISGDNFSNPAGNWGTLGVSSPLNKPDSRAAGLMWYDQNGHFYFFGGSNGSWPDKYSDLWKFTIDPTCASCSSLPQALFTAPNQICPGTCTDFTNASINSTSYLWSFPGGNPTLSTDANPTNICYNTPGSYDVTLIAFNGANSDTTTLFNFITVFPSPPPQGILQSGDTLFANAGAIAYQWYHDGVLIPGATEYFYVATSGGNYNVVATDNNGCEVEAVIFDVIAGLSQFPVSSSQFAVFPNPATDKLEIRNLPAGSNLTIIIYNNIGEKVFESKEEKVQPELSIDVASLTAGLYYLELTDGKTSARKVFTKK